MGFSISFAGMLTFKKADDLRATAAATPLERTLIETDCPLLAPHPKRGARNEPSYLPFIAEALGAIHGASAEAIGHITAENARRLFSVGMDNSPHAQ